MRVLLVEDDEEVRALLAYALERQGLEVTQAVDGTDALAALAAAQVTPDVLVTDMVMPGMDGEGLVSKVRSLPGLSAVPVLIVTAVPGHPHLRDLRDDPLVMVVAKPVRVRLLADMIRELLSRRPTP